MSDAYKYVGFISYSHKDKAAADKLLKQLETYRIPKRLVGGTRNTPSDKRPVPRRVGKLFRDREELAAAESLTAEVKRALADSEYMIVLCSPSAAASRWVNREIIEFKKLSGERRILSVILSGEPFATDHGKPDLECFPPALRYKLGNNHQLTKTPAEPLAADFRPEGDGERRGKLKLVAGLLDIDLDKLIERDLQRKIRRVTFLTAASVGALIGMSWLTYEAVTARREAEENRNQAIAAQQLAEHNRGEAEGLIEFMLTDLRDKLEPVGRLEALDAVGAKAVKYYDRQTLADMPSDAIGRRARAFHHLGEIQSLQGKKAAASMNFDAAYLATKALVEREPQNTSRIFEHAQSVYWVANFDWQLGNYDPAEAAFHEYRQLAERLVTIESTNLDWQLELAYANSNLGTFYLQQRNQPREALEMFEAALHSFKLIADAKPNDQEAILNLADAHAWVADASKSVKGVPAALEQRRIQMEYFDRLLALAPDDHKVIRRKLGGLWGLGQLHIEAGHDIDAVRKLQEADQYAQQLLLHDPDNTGWIKGAVATNLFLADAFLHLSEYNQAKDALDSVDKHVQTWFAKDQSNIVIRAEYVIWSMYLQAKLSFLQEKFEVAQDNLSAMHSEMSKRSELFEKSTRNNFLRAAANVLNGKIQSSLGNHKAAQKHWEAVLDLAHFPLAQATLETQSQILQAARFLERENLERSLSKILTQRGARTELCK